MGSELLMPLTGLWVCRHEGQGCNKGTFERSAARRMPEARGEGIADLFGLSIS